MKAETIDITDVLHVIREVNYGDEDTAASLVDENTEDLQELWQWLMALWGLGKSRRLTQEAVERAMVRLLKDDAIRLDESLVRVLPPEPVTVIKDHQALIEYLDLSAGAMLAFPAHALSVQGVRKYAESVGDNPDAVEHRFFSYRYDQGPPRIKVNRMEYAPRWALKLMPGERMRVPEGVKTWET